MRDVRGRFRKNLLNDIIYFHLINNKNLILIDKISPLIFITKIEYLDDFYNQKQQHNNTKTKVDM